MSQEVHLTDVDYNTIKGWYRLAFGTNKIQPKIEDEQTLGKITIMQIGAQEELQQWQRMNGTLK